MIIKVLTSDCQIWNLQEVCADISWAMSQQVPIVLEFCFEGPDFKTLPLAKFIENESVRYSYDLKNITINTSNQLEDYSLVNVKKLFPDNLVLNTLEYEYSVSKVKNLKHFGLFIGRNNAPRLLLSEHLYRQHRDISIHTNHLSFENEFALANIGLEELVTYYGIKDIRNVAEYINQCPINSIDVPINKALPRNPAQQLLDSDKESFLKNYNNFFVEIVCETFYTGDTFFPTEKTWRPMLLKTPFIVQGPTGYLKNLRDLGFRTFNQWWDEGYDHDAPSWSIHEVVKVIDHLATLPSAELSWMLKDMADVLEHNHNRFLELCKQA